MEKGKGSSTTALGFTRSSGLPSAVYFFITQLRTLPPWLLKVTWKRSVSMEKLGSTFAWVTGAVGALAASCTTCTERRYAIDRRLHFIRRFSSLGLADRFLRERIACSGRPLCSACD